MSATREGDSFSDTVISLASGGFLSNHDPPVQPEI